MEAVVFFVCAAAVLAGALGVVLARNPVHSALFLLMTLVSVAVLFLQPDAALVAAIQIVVYASAIVVLFLFVITLLGVDRHESLDEPHPFQRAAAIVLGVLDARRRSSCSCRQPLGDRRALDARRARRADDAATSRRSPRASSPTSSGRSRSPRCCS